MCGWSSGFRSRGEGHKPEVGVQFGAGGDTSAEELEAEGTRDAGWAIYLAKRCLEAGAEIVMIESEGITENVSTWRTDVVARVISELGLERVMFEAADPEVFAWYVKNYGPSVNLFVDHSQIVQLECLRSGIWGTKSLWGRVGVPEWRVEGATGEWRMARRGVNSTVRDRESGYRLFDHTADAGLVAWGPDPASAFAEATRHVRHHAGGGPFRREEPYGGEVDVEAEGGDWSDLLVNWLAELVFLFDTEQFVPTEVTIAQCELPGARAA